MEGLRKMARYGFVFSCNPRRLYGTKVDLRKLRPMILKRIENRAQCYPVRRMIPVANEVLQARNVLIHGVSTLLNFLPLMACKFCPEIYIGEQGHLIQTCRGYKHRAKNRVHEWIKGGADLPDENLNSSSSNLEVASESVPVNENLSPDDLASIANKTLTAWEDLRSGVERLLLVYPVKVCKYCSEVHVGPSGHKARLCGIFAYESWKGAHFWVKANVDDLVPPKIVWRRRPHDPPVLVNEGKEFYGHAPAVLDLCSKAGAIVPKKYNYMMKLQGLSGPANTRIFGITTEPNF
ncbi:hypothetical protein LR48_Vigan05g159300 [Vigna angularis]|uniref:APO domain-containing protein n=1 Tax=Phaseolus angularis TaxID=3914 RepID=A0A0L9UMN0_PHAAN|nr:hypothetical protein LR48_Vigan05g159300 [Vigna angularis]